MTAVPHRHFGNADIGKLNTEELSGRNKLSNGTVFTQWLRDDVCYNDFFVVNS